MGIIASKRFQAVCACLCLLGMAGCKTGQAPCETAAAKRMAWIAPSKDGSHFVCTPTGERFVAWGFNYDHDDAGRLLEAYWTGEWATVVEDFQEMKALGANVVRVHLQVSAFMKAPREPNPDALKRLSMLVRLAEETGLYLDITGLGCYRKKEVPAWYDALPEAERWEVQASFWEAVAKVAAASPAIFCYDLMNEPVLTGGGGEKKEWLVGEFAGSCFVQRLTLDLAGRTREQVVKSWVEKMAGAIRRHDRRHMITVGEIPWALVFPGAQPLFSKETAKELDFVSVHIYPKKGEVEKALKALAVYDFGRPLVVEEIFPLECGIEELDAFIEGSRPLVDGWIGFYWGTTVEEYARKPQDIRAALIKGWLDYFKAKKR